MSDSEDEDSSSNLEVDALKNMLHGSQPQRMAPPINMTKVHRVDSQSSINGSITNSARLWDELENVYHVMEQREKDYAIAVEIGKMLLDKNKELQEENLSYQQHYEQYTNNAPAGRNKLQEENGNLTLKIKKIETEEQRVTHASTTVRKRKRQQRDESDHARRRIHKNGGKNLRAKNGNSKFEKEK